MRALIEVLSTPELTMLAVCGAVSQAWSAG